MYLTRPENDIYALDAETGRVMWTYSTRTRSAPTTAAARSIAASRSWATALFMNTLDMHVIAIDAKSGRELWKTEMFDYTAAGGYAATGAPLIVKDKVIVGMAGGEHAISGFLDAYDAETGKRLWRFNTIPQPGEPNFGTWAGDSWKTGGVATWNNGSYDPETNTVFWGTSNPWPDYNGDFRAGDNLYSCSVLALDPDTGKLKWHYQFTPHDTHDWDATQIPILLDALVPRPRPQVAGVGRPQRLLLPARPQQRRVSARQELREADLGEGLRRQGPPRSHPRQRADARRATTRCSPASTAGPTGCRTATAR